MFYITYDVYFPKWNKWKRLEWSHEQGYWCTNKEDAINLFKEMRAKESNEYRIISVVSYTSY